jgi:DNA-binding transcriptional ArsR family regulator
MVAEAAERMNSDALNAQFAALADATRREVVRALLTQPRRAGELAEMVSMSPPALSRHLRVLRRCGVVVEKGVAHDARVRIYSLSPGAFEPLRAWLAEIEALWTDQLQAFKAHAERSRGARGRQA